MSLACLSRRAVILAVAAGACQSSSALTEPPVEPPRLAPWTLEADGLAPVLRGMLDRQEDVHCRFIHAADGALRCLPMNADLYDSGVFADPTCTQRVFLAERTAWSGAAFDRPVTVSLPRLGCEPQRFEVREMRRVGDDGARFRLDGAVCVPAPPREESLPAYFSLVSAAILPPERWVAGEETDGDRVTDRLRIRDVATADGTRVGHHLVDDRWNRTCTLSSDGCWPPTLDPGSFYYSDAACSEGHQLFFPDECEPPVLIGAFSRSQLFALGPRWNGPIFRGTKGCFPDGETSGANLPFTKGPPLEADAVAPAPLEPVGTGRLRAYGLRRGDGEVVPLASPLLPYERIHDTESGQDCTPMRTRAGEIRCLPEGVQTATAYDFGTFADAACTQPAFICNTGPTCAGREVVRLRYDASGEVVDAELRTTSRDLASAGQPYARVGGACVPFLGLVGLAEWGDELSWDKYPLLRERNGLRRAAP